MPGTTATHLRGREPSPGESQDHSQPMTITAEHEEEGEEGGGGVVRAVHVRHVEPHAISTVLEGLQLLEQQVREYVHMEILLTDKFRAEMRQRHLRKKSHGYSPAGLEDARRAMDRLESEASQLKSSSTSPNSALNGARNALGGGAGGYSRLYLSKLRASFEAMCDEYSDCVHYMSRVSNSLVKIPEVDDFLTYIDNDLDHDPRQKKKTKDRKNHQAAVDKSSSVFSFFSRTKKPDPNPSPSSSSLSLLSSRNHHHHNHHHHHHHHLPTITTSTSTDDHPKILEEDSLLPQLKQLVANYEMVKHKLSRLENRFRREYDHRRRAFDAAQREKEEEVRNLQLRLKEMEAEKEKFRGLYDKMKVAFAKKR